MGKNKLEEMKNSYEKIKIPDNLKILVEDSIREAEEDMRKEEMKKKVYRYTVRIAGTAAAAMLAITILTNSSASIASAMEGIPVIGAIAKAVTFRTYKDVQEEKKMEADITVPKVAIDGDANEELKNSVEEVNKSVKEYTDEIIAQYEKDVAQTEGEGHESFYMDYDVATDNDALFSLRINTVIASGSSGSTSKIYTIDKKADKRIALKDLFEENADYQTVLTDNIKSQMREQMKQNEEIIYNIDSEMPEEDFTTLSEDADFYVNKDGKLTIVFDEYEVAPGYMGEVEMVIPTDAIKDIVKDGYVK